MGKNNFNAEFAFGDALQIISDNQNINEKQMVVEIDMELLDENPKNEQIFDMGEETVEEMMVTLKEDGFKGAINVFKLDNGRYEIFSGHRRKRAMQALGETKMPCLVYENVDDITKTKLLLRSNTIARTHTPYSYAKMIDTYIKDVLIPSGYKGDKQIAAAEFMNMKRTQVSRYISLLKLIPELQEFTKESSFPFSALSDCTRKMPEGQQKELAEYIAKYQEKNPDIPITSNMITAKANQIRGKQQGSSKKKEKNASSEIKINFTDYNNPTMAKIEEVHVNAEDNKYDKEEYNDRNNYNYIKTALQAVIDTLLPLMEKDINIDDIKMIGDSAETLERVINLVKKG